MLAASGIAAGSTTSPAQRERVLLMLASIFVILNRLALMLVRDEHWTVLWPIVVWLVCATVLHFALNVSIPQRDPLILPVVLLLTGWGLTLIARLAPPFGIRQTFWLPISTAATFAITTLPPNLRVLQRFRYSWLLAGLILLSGTLVFGVNPSGDAFAPRLWLGIAGIYFQPSEALKILFIIFLASYLADKRDLILTTQVRIGPWRVPALPYFAPMVLMWGFCIVLLVWQRDLGAASLFFLVFLAMLYTSTGEGSYPLLGFLLLTLAGVLGYQMFDVVRLRVDTWWNPWIDPDNRAYQIVQSLLAVASGGVIGQGIGLGAPTYIPVVHSDFVFAAIAEEYGLAGALGALICMALLVMRALRIALENTRRPFRSLLAVGIGLLFAIQSMLIMGGVLKLVPLTGVTFPFVSYGGSSLLSSFVMIGLLLRLSDSSSRLPDGWLRRRLPETEFLP